MTSQLVIQTEKLAAAHGDLEDKHRDEI